jgi:hypothetical protein
MANLKGDHVAGYHDFRIADLLSSAPLNAKYARISENTFDPRKFQCSDLDGTFCSCRFLILLGLELFFRQIISGLG